MRAHGRAEHDRSSPSSSAMRSGTQLRAADEAVLLRAAARCRTASRGCPRSGCRRARGAARHVLGLARPTPPRSPARADRAPRPVAQVAAHPGRGGLGVQTVGVAAPPTGASSGTRRASRLSARLRLRHVDEDQRVDARDRAACSGCSAAARTRPRSRPRCRWGRSRRPSSPASAAQPILGRADPLGAHLHDVPAADVVVQRPGPRPGRAPPRPPPRRPPPSPRARPPGPRARPRPPPRRLVRSLRRASARTLPRYVATAMASPPRTREREEERRASNARTLAIASCASAAAAAVTSQLWIAGTWIAAAVTPVLVAAGERAAAPAERAHRPRAHERRARPRPRPAERPPRPRTRIPTRASAVDGRRPGAGVPPAARSAAPRPRIALRRGVCHRGDRAGRGRGGDHGAGADRRPVARAAGTTTTLRRRGPAARTSKQQDTGGDHHPRRSPSDDARARRPRTRARPPPSSPPPPRPPHHGADHPRTSGNIDATSRRDHALSSAGPGPHAAQQLT